MAKEGVYLPCMNNLLLLAIIISLTGCSSQTHSIKKSEKDITYKSSTTSTTTFNETFEVFFKKFSTDSVYQLSRIVFPLNVEELETDDARISTMTAKEWGYMNFVLKKPYLMKTISVNDTTKVNVQMEDTGVYVDYLFTTIDGKWMLVKIVDQST